MTGVKVFKFHGIGNDFVVLDRRSGDDAGRDIDAPQSVALCDRRRGIGADGVLVLLPSAEKGAVAKMVVHNADGSIAEMCGNGLRCAVKYLADHDGGQPAEIDVDTGAGVLRCAVGYENGRCVEVTVAMGRAHLVARNLPSGRTGKPFLRREIEGHHGVVGTAVSMGNPHLVLFDRPLSEATSLGPKLEVHPHFPDRTNVEFTRLAGPGEGLEVVVWERGSGLTQACGTGACAAVAAYVVEGALPADAWIPVKLPGGSLAIKVAADLSAVTLRGPAAFVFEAVVPANLAR